MKNALLYYDGDCPFCNRYAKLIELRRCINLELCDARENLSYKNFDPNVQLDDGVILIVQNTTLYQGVDALNYLDNICKFKGLIFTLQRWVFANKYLGAAVYWFLKILRRIALKLKRII